jgi:hypothetical protein
VILFVFWATGVSGDEREALLKPIPVCYNFNCKNHANVSLTLSEWQTVTKGFSPAPVSAEQEREYIKEAIARLEELVGRYTPTWRDVGTNLPTVKGKDSSFPGQLDCIDESINTTTYLELLSKEGLLKYHVVSERAYRRSLFNQHWAAQIVESANNESFVIDSWFYDNGEPPYIESLVTWADLSIFSRFR